MSGNDRIFDESLMAAVSSIGLTLTEDQRALFLAHFHAMIESNRVVNLTRIVDPRSAAVAHYADSLACLKWNAANPRRRSLLDIGSGAGFPALPVAVCRPEWQVTAIDGTLKKIEFLRVVARELRMTNLTAVHAHSQHWATTGRFDIVTLRAVAPLSKCLKTATKYVAPEGAMIIYKTDKLEQSELDEATETAGRLQLVDEPKIAYQLDLEGETLHRELHVYTLAAER